MREMWRGRRDRMEKMRGEELRRERRKEREMM
jgi:hypothetical protein